MVVYYRRAMINLEKFTDLSKAALESAVTKAGNFKNSYIEPIHLLSALLDQNDTSVRPLLELLNVPLDIFCGEVDEIITSLPTISNEQMPMISQELTSVLEQSHKVATALKDEFVSTEHLLIALCEASKNDKAHEILYNNGVHKENIISNLFKVRGNMNVKDTNPESKYKVLEKYGIDLTAIAKSGGLDPVIGRDEEIRRLMQVLSRRTKNNPVLIGDPGVGKTAIVANMATSLSRAGKKILIIDADLGLANIDVVFGLSPTYNLNHFFAGEQSLATVLTPGPGNIKILPAGSGIQRFTHLEVADRIRLVTELDALNEDFDVVLIDTEAGISENVTFFTTASHEILVIATPEPTAITDAYALMKLSSQKYQEKNFNLVVNQIESQHEAMEVYQKLTMVANRYLDIFITFWGGIPVDRKMHEAIRRQRVMIDLYPSSRTSMALVKLAGKFMSQPRATRPKGTMQFFWQNLLSFAPDE